MEAGPGDLPVATEIEEPGAVEADPKSLRERVEGAAAEVVRADGSAITTRVPAEIPLRGGRVAGSKCSPGLVDHPRRVTELADEEALHGHGRGVADVQHSRGADVADVEIGVHVQDATVSHGESAGLPN